MLQACNISRTLCMCENRLRYRRERAFQSRIHLFSLIPYFEVHMCAPSSPLPLFLRCTSESSMYHISHLRKPQLRKTVEKECVSIGCICISVKQFLRARVSSVCLAFENAASFRICDQLSSHSCSPSATSVRAAVFRVTTFLERHSRIPDRRVEA